MLLTLALALACRRVGAITPEREGASFNEMTRATPYGPSLHSHQTKRLRPRVHHPTALFVLVLERAPGDQDSSIRFSSQAKTKIQRQK